MGTTEKTQAISSSFTNFYSGKRVLVTGSTGFKGTWLCQALLHFGADVTGYSLLPPTDPALFTICNMQEKVRQFYGDMGVRQESWR